VASLSARAIDDVQAGTRTLYEIIDELRHEHASPGAVKALDMVVQELGRTQENLDEALERLEKRPIPVGGRQVLNELKVRARLAGVDNLHVPPAPDEVAGEPLDWGDIGIAIMLGVSALILLALAIVVTVRH
jgi:hypothetical protein